MKLGDMVASVATPVARELELPCVDPTTQQLRPESRCNKWRQGLNDFSDVLYDTFWPTTNEENK